MRLFVGKSRQEDFSAFGKTVQISCNTAVRINNHGGSTAILREFIQEEREFSRTQTLEIVRRTGRKDGAEFISLIRYGF